MKSFRTSLLAAAALLASAALAQAQTPFKIGLIVPMTGPSQSTGKQIDAAVKLYVKEHGDVVAGRKIEVILRDDAGVPDTTKRMAQDVVVKDHVDALVVPSVAGPFGTWAAQNGSKKIVTVVSDYGPGLDAETWFTKNFAAAGGEVLASLRVPLANPDFSPFLQRVADAKPDTVFVFTPSGMGAVFMKQFIERGLDKSGIKLIATGDVTDDDQLQAMGDVTLGVVTAGPYSASHDSKVNKAFVTAFKAANPGMRPNFMAVFGYDGMQVIYDALKKTGGKGDGAALVEAMKGDSFESPRGQVSIDAATRDVVMNVYLRKVEKVGGELYNQEFSAIYEVRDPAKTAAK